MNTRQTVIFCIILLATVVFVYVRDRRQRRRQIEESIRRGWGQTPERKYSGEGYENISHYFRNTADGRYVIDDITWNDLDMDSVFKKINNTHSSAGQEYLYRMLRMPVYSQTELNEFEKLVNAFGANEKMRIDLQKAYTELGFTRKIAITDYIDTIMNVGKQSSFVHYAGLGMIAAGAAVCFVNSTAGILWLVAAIAYTVISYYRYKAKIEAYFICINNVIKLTSCARIIGSYGYDELKEYNYRLLDYVRKFDKVTSGAWLLGNAAGMDGSLIAVVLDYVRMLTHIDLIKFNSIVKRLDGMGEDIYGMLEALGRIEAAIAVASFRENLGEGKWCIPKLGGNSDGKPYLSAHEIYHPLIDNPIANSIAEERCVLLTGSNASGKSTFLKTIAINAILAQTINTVTAQSYESCYFRIYSSMALKDNLKHKESYYIVEIKALKRIMEALEDNCRVPVLCFIDEVLRGTNTVERIAASSQILHEISGKNAICFAATHDIELTEILENDYANYHFEEEVRDKDIFFNYRLFGGRATSRNAIKLLGIMGYDDDIIKNAENMARNFIENGEWR